ncbi:hypothetical protein E3N88_29855 [Mikania micrantha]|uniref:MLO-like protein n=1 Tax=Mikania micrantha TaxID=192012 RepID=A0A5N6MKR2_9ASTR|nr:hypothetical protein E3N88_29855 [Mikania micrantha]
MAGDTSEGTRQLDQTPTWAVAGVCTIIIIISIALEKLIHKLGKFFTEKRKKAMCEALEKVKAELMILGFISLILTFSQYYIAKICIPDSVADTMLPCPVRNKSRKDEKGGQVSHRLLFSYEARRYLAESSNFTCEKGKVPIITVDGLHQLHILIFFLAVLHVAYSAITMALGRLKIRGWKQWEGETSSDDYEFSNGWQALFWASLLPLIVILAVGTKLQAILTKMALEITERHAVVQGIPLVQASDKYFWFSKPHLILHLIHFVLFQNAFQITYFFWIWYEYNIGSCFHDNIKLVIAKLVIGVGVLVLCSYITLPLYALVSQMGSNMKKSIFDEQTSKALKNWRMAAVKKKHVGGSVGSNSPPTTPENPSGSSPTPSTSTSLNRFKTIGHSARSMGHAVADDSFDTHSVNVQVDHQKNKKVDFSNQDHNMMNEDDFSFDKPVSLSIYK